MSEPVTSPARDERRWTLRTGGDSLGCTNPDHAPGRHYHVVSVSPAITEDGDLVVIPLAAHEAALAAARQVDEARLTEVRGLVGQAHATLCLMWGSPDVKRAQSSLQQAQSILAALLAALTPEPEEKRDA